MSRRNIILMAALLLLLVAAIPWWIDKKQKETKEDEVRRCLQDPNCRSRLQAAVNDVYSQIGYENSTSEN
ncbi:MAG: hypothetical protein A2756_05435 [Candidatus Ryanbacteria bacterium RIFCSPHIGHO2_01_FULL_48_27]|uniref:Uncharacterized protein n=1 Tax=Candidatus Ryanbacteria bacterium RIFCSPHIGHO2_01_FULL_48_27 TaxID=1802115 RepID=A0A1G2G5F5_9BACT|nr:MAG: hypothetical protein A2756_05435 [Candidatus Ryanbacteria bacterium RIFCSPHIGHO2_01_FULL_48_27]